MILYKSRKLIKFCNFYPNLDDQQLLSSQQLIIGLGIEVDTTISLDKYLKDKNLNIIIINMQLFLSIYNYYQ